MRPAGRRLTTSLRRGAPALALLALIGCGDTADPVTPSAKKISGLYDAVLIIAVIIFVGVVGVLLYSVVKFRKAPDDDELPPQLHGNTTAEVVWTLIPTIIVLILFGMSYSTLRVIDKPAPMDKVAAVIHVRGFQWSWEFDYGDGKVISDPGGVPEMVVPVGETIRVIETSDNVIHAFFVPSFLFKRDDVPGRQNQFDFLVSIPGTYKGQCAELCGTGHAKMNFRVRAVSRAEFDKWLEKAGGNACDKVKTPPAPSSTLTIHSIPNVADWVAEDKCQVAKAGAPIALTFSNGGGLDHNVAIATEWPNADKFGLPTSTIIKGGSITYQVPALPAGSYTFFCQVHPNMKGELVAK